LFDPLEQTTQDAYVADPVVFVVARAHHRYLAGH
jgi:hypothetical protein